MVMIPNKAEPSIAAKDKLPPRPPAPAAARPAGRPEAALAEARERAALGIEPNGAPAAPIGSAPGLGGHGGEWEEEPYELALEDREARRWVATVDQLRTIASYATAGLDVVAIARQIGQPKEKIQRVLRSKAMQPYLEGARAKSARRMEFGLLKLESLNDKALENIETVLDDPAHREWASTSKWVAERAMRKQLTPALADDSINISVTMTNQIAALVEDRTVGFAKVAKLIPRDALGDLQHLQKGKDARTDVPEGIDEDILDELGATATE